jgi:hypothetical protein
MLASIRGTCILEIHNALREWRISFFDSNTCAFVMVRKSGTWFGLKEDRCQCIAHTKDSSSVQEPDH